MKHIRFTGLAVSWLLLGVLANPGQAEIVTPEGCTPVVTAHQNSCVTTAVFSCDAGIVYHRFVEETLGARHLYTDQWTPLEWIALEPGLMETARVEQSVLPNTLADLVASGRVEEAGQFTLNSKIIKNRVYTPDRRDHVER